MRSSSGMGNTIVRCLCLINSWGKSYVKPGHRFYVICLIVWTLEALLVFRKAREMRASFLRLTNGELRCGFLEPTIRLQWGNATRGPRAHSYCLRMLYAVPIPPILFCRVARVARLEHVKNDVTDAFDVL